MSEIEKYKGQKEKLENLCAEHNLTSRLRHDGYPITLTIRPMQGMYEQLSLLERAEDGEGRISQDAALILFLKDTEVEHQFCGTFTISETLFRKFINIFKKLCSFWMQYYYRETIENHALKSGCMPVIDEEEADEAEEAPGPDGDDQEPGENDNSPDEELYEKAKQLVRLENKCNLSLLQRRLSIGYSKAMYIVDLLEERGVVGPIGESGKREVLPIDAPEEGE